MFLVMSGFERDTLFGQLVALACNALAAIILIPRFGAEGAAYAAALGLLTWNFILAVKFVQRLKLRPSIF
jgi:O-antigen/teichoic acid export membrane protein